MALDIRITVQVLTLQDSENPWGNRPPGDPIANYPVWATRLDAASDQSLDVGRNLTLNRRDWIVRYNPAFMQAPVQHLRVLDQERTYRVTQVSQEARPDGSFTRAPIPRNKYLRIRGQS